MSRTGIKSTRGSAPRSPKFGGERRPHFFFDQAARSTSEPPVMPAPPAGNPYKLCRFYRFCLPWDLEKPSSGVDLFFLPQELNRK
jgi:hypothetical protein